MKRCRGFTLIEIMVAMLILGIMTALGYSAYRAARISAERTEESLQRSKEIEFGVRLLVQDLVQAAPRPVRDILSTGSPYKPAFRGTGGAGTVSPDTSSSLGGISSSGSLLSSSPSLLSSSRSSFSSSSSSPFGGGSDASVTSMLDLTRMGWSNTAGQQRGTLQRVSYALVDDTLKRAYQINTDAVQGTKPVVQDLMKGVKGVQFRYLDSNQTWQGSWPANAAAAALTSTTDNSLAQRPVAVEVVIEFKDWGRIRRIVEVAG